MEIDYNAHRIIGLSFIKPHQNDEQLTVNHLPGWIRIVHQWPQEFS